MPRNIKVFSLQEWDNLVESTYNKPYSFQQQDGCKERGTFYFTVPIGYEDYEDREPPESYKTSIMGVSFKSWLKHNISENPSLSETLLWKRLFYSHVSMIINDLYKKGLIKEGDYIINIDW